MNVDWAAVARLTRWMPHILKFLAKLDGTDQLLEALLKKPHPRALDETADRSFPYLDLFWRDLGDLTTFDQSPE
jgi:hypothetical protein